MKSLAFYISVLSLGGALLSSCNIIDLQEVKVAPLSDNAALDSAETKNGIETPVKKVLLEDYTGHQCGNCPGAALEAKAQKAKYGERLIVMAVHAGYFAKYDHAPFTTNFTTPEGEEWWTTGFGGVANPTGMVNRIKTGSTAFQGVSTWSGSITTQMALAPKVGLTLTTVYRPETRRVNIKVHSEYLENLTGEYNLAVFITEDGIVSYQKNYGPGSGGDPAYPIGEVPNYVHSHALRAAVDGAWGHLNKANPAQNDKTDFYFAYDLKPEWNEKKCSVVAFIYNKDTKEVVQVEEKHLY